VCTVASSLKIKIPMEGFRRHSDKSSGPITMSIYDFWDMTSYSLVDWYEHLGGKCCLHFLGRSVSYPKDGSSRSLRNRCNTYQTTRCHTPQLINLDIHRYKNLRHYEDALTGVASPPNIVERKENKQ